jgi:hypothetical protein
LRVVGRASCGRFLRIQYYPTGVTPDDLRGLSKRPQKSAAHPVSVRKPGLVGHHIDRVSAALHPQPRRLEENSRHVDRSRTLTETFDCPRNISTSVDRNQKHGCRLETSFAEEGPQGKNKWNDRRRCQGRGDNADRPAGMVGDHAIDDRR